MDIIFNCTNCEQELAMDASGAGSSINCPTCNASLVVPSATTQNVQSAKTVAPKEEKHFVVPQHKAGAVLIHKPRPTLEVAAKETDKKIRVKTVRHSDCVEVGKDKFDDVVTEFLQKVGEENLISISPVTYQHPDVASQKLMDDYAVIIVFKG